MNKATKSYFDIKNIGIVNIYGLVYIINNIPATPLSQCEMRNHGGFFYFGGIHAEGLLKTTIIIHKTS